MIFYGCQCIHDNRPSQDQDRHKSNGMHCAAIHSVQLLLMATSAANMRTLKNIKYLSRVQYLKLPLRDGTIMGYLCLPYKFLTATEKIQYFSCVFSDKWKIFSNSVLTYCIGVLWNMSRLISNFGLPHQSSSLKIIKKSLHFQVLD